MERGISEETCRYLRCGFFDAKRGALAKRLVFQIAGPSPNLKERTLLSHMGRATTEKQEGQKKMAFLQRVQSVARTLQHRQSRTG